MADFPDRGMELRNIPYFLQAEHPATFVQQHLSPLTFETDGEPFGNPDCVVVDEEHFWRQAAQQMLYVIHFFDFVITDWFPRTPGVYWGTGAKEARSLVWAGAQVRDPELGELLMPQTKERLIEVGGIGTIRLFPKQIDGTRYWLATALKQHSCDAGIPLAIPDALMQTGLQWGQRVDFTGRIRFLNEAGLEEISKSISRSRPLIVFVESMVSSSAPGPFRTPVMIRPTILFDGMPAEYGPQTGKGYCFVTCTAGDDTELSEASEWMERYARKFGGSVITNCDEQLPFLANAPLSYQRLVANTYDRGLAQGMGGQIIVERLDKLYIQEMSMANNVNIGGQGVVNIGGTMGNVNQSNVVSQGLDAAQTAELKGLVDSLRAEVAKVQSSNPDEAAEITEALDKAVEGVSKPTEERKAGILQHRMERLIQTGKLLADAAPSVLTAATSLGHFIQGLIPH